MDDKQEQSIYSLSEADEAHENEVAKITGRVDADDQGAFAGSGAADGQARRVARLEYQESDFEPDVIDNYPGPRHGSEVRDHQGWLDFCNYREALAREKYPDYDEKVNKWLLPRLPEVDPQKLREYLLRDDCADIAYEVAGQLEAEHISKAPTQEEIDSLSGEQFQERLDQWMRDARGPHDEPRQKSSLTRRDLRVLNRLSPNDFAAALDILKARGE